jgi:putative ABC transport system permease protein
MIQNYLKVAWRNLMKNKVFSFINIFGLSVGLTCCLLIGLYLYHELSYDRHHKNVERIFQLGTIFIKEGEEDRMGTTPAPMAARMQMEFPEIEKSTRLMRTYADDKTLFQVKDTKGDIQSFFETKGYLADSSFFQVLTYDFREGNPVSALTEPNSVVISEEISNKIFGAGSALNKVIRISSSTNGDHDFKITGVFFTSKTPTHIDARFFMSASGGDARRHFDRPDDLASNNMFYTYFLLKPGADPKQLEAKFPAFISKYAAAALNALGFYKRQFLTPVRDVHLFSNTTGNVTESGSVTYLYILGSIALFTLLIACVNFMNLSTARSSKRSAEVGVRKVLGAHRSSLIRQFIGESLMLALIAFALALVLAGILLPVFSEMTGKEIVFSFDEHRMLVGGFLLLAIITGLLAGTYPAFYLSSFQPVKVLKGRINNTLAAVSLRKALVVFQFVISAGLILSAVVINGQMKYLRSKELGFEKEQQIVIPLRSQASKAMYTSFKSELQKNPKISNAGASMYYPGISNPSDMPLYKEGSDMAHSKKFYMNWVDENFLQTMGITPVAGRIFSKDFPGDTSLRMVINLEGVKQLGFTSAAEAVGRNVLIDWQGETVRWEVIGVVKDFHFQDLHAPIAPYGFQLNNVPLYNYIIAHAGNENLSAVLGSLEATWKNLNPNEPFEYSFLDDDFQKNYEAENRLAGMVRNFTIIAILISCLGLFGLATFSAEQRTREIGIRKVLGASVGSIVRLISKEFLVLVFIAIVIASPLSWWVMNRWLQNFAYRIGIDWWMFVVAALIAIVIAILTVSSQALKAAMANPVRNIKTE